MRNPRVNIYMPAYEPQKEHIQAAIESVLAQTESDWTLLIHDDHSQREAVAAHVEPYLHDPRIHYRRDVQNRGIGGAWNACRDYGDAEIVAYLFHDDLWEPRYLERALHILEEHPDVDFVSLHHTYLIEGQRHPIYDEAAQFIEQNIQPGVHQGTALLLWWMEQGLRPNIIGEPSFVVLKRNLLEKVGPFREDMKQFLDSEFWIRCLEHGNWYYCPEDLGKFRVHPGGASAQNQASGQGLFDRFDCFAKLVRRLPPENRTRGRRAFEASFEEMIGKFLDRLGQKKTVSTQGSGALKKFCLKHPLLVSKLLWRQWRKRRTRQTPFPK